LNDFDDAGLDGLTEHDRATLDAILARLIPSDSNGPGAREAKVLRYLERSLAGDYRGHATGYADGLAAIDRHANATYGSSFAGLAPEQQDAILADAERDRVPGFADGSAAFFELVRRHTLEGMFGDPSWGGNADLLGWHLLGYPGPRAVWTADEQRLDIAGG
jgi:gluconate 2-dehydrogenase gamma chain